MSQSIKVAILGGGIGGLTVAHELSKYPLFDISVFERNTQLGGQAQAITMSDGMHSEYCWHAVAQYVHLPQVLSEIPHEDKTVLDHLKPIDNYVYITRRGEFRDTSTSFLLHFEKFNSVLSQLTGKRHLIDTLKAFKMLFYLNCLPERKLEELDDEYWADRMASYSKEFQRWAVDSTSIYMGMQQHKINTHLMFDLLRHNKNGDLLDKSYDFFSFDGPIHKVWFAPWKSLLEQRGVTFYMDHTIEKLHYDGHLLTGIDVMTPMGLETFSADVFFSGLDVKSLAKLYPIHDEFSKLYTASRQIQTQVLYRLSYRLPEEMNTVYIFSDSPWFLMTRHEGSLWDLVDEDYLSCGIGMWNTKGYNGKTAQECTPEELAEECWNQMREHASYIFQKQLPTWNVWGSFEFKDNELTTFEPKFSNNVGTLCCRPETNDSYFGNLYHATAYTRTDVNVYNMDSATEAGLRAVNALVGDRREIKPIYQPSFFFRTMQKFYGKCCM